MNRAQYEYLLETLNFCCISGETLLDVVKVAREIDGRKDPDYTRETYYTALAERFNWHKNYVELILEVLDSKGITEHGTSVRGSWLDFDKGYKWLDKYDELRKESDDVAE